MNVTDLVRRELLGEFRQSARERLDRIGTTWVAFEAEADKRATHSKVLLRELHTLKGEAKLMGYGPVSQLVHHLEELVITIERAGYRRADEVGDLVLRAVDALGEQIDRDPEAAITAAFTALEARITTARERLGTAATNDKPAPAAGAPEPITTEAFVRVDIATAHHLAEEASDAVIAQARYRHAVGKLRTCADELAAVVDAAMRMCVVPQIVPAHERLVQTIERLAEDVHTGDSTIRALEIDSRRLRMIPLAPLLRQHVRAVRSLAQDLGKKASLHINDGNISVDRQVGERLAGPLVHLLRNCVDHGIEAPEDRIKAGKPESGRITIAAERIGGEVVVIVEDDGGGVDLEAVRTRATSLGLIAAGAQLDEAELVGILFTPGFSTRQRATDVSGRGVGLDVVKSQIESLGGAVRMATRRGQGTRFELQVPVSVALTRALIIEDNNQHFAIPHSAVEAVLRIDPNTIATIHTRRHINFRGVWIPVVELAAALALQATAVSNELRALIVRHEDQRVAVLVDAWYGDAEIVIKPLGEVAASRVAMGACTIDGGGVALVLSPSELVARALGDVPRIRLAAESAVARSAQRILLVEDSAITRTMIAQLLRMYGYHVAEAEDGARALHTLEDFAADAVITDVEMPQLDGIELIKRMRSDARWTAVPVIVLSTRGSVDDKQRAAVAGADAYLVKTEFSESALRDVLARHLEKGG